MSNGSNNPYQGNQPANAGYVGMNMNPYNQNYQASQGAGNYHYPYGYNPGQAGQQMHQGGAGGPAGSPPTSGQQLPQQASYIENILRMNQGKVATVYQSFENESDWSSKVFKGTVEAAGKDHIILKEVNGKTRYLLLMIYVDYITFEGEMNYFYPAAQYSLGNP